MNQAEFDRSSKIYTTILLGATSLFLILLVAIKVIPQWSTGSLLIALFVVYIGSVAYFIYRGTLIAPESDSDSESDDDDSDKDSDDGNSRRSSASSRAHLTPQHSPADEDADPEQGHQLALLSPSQQPKPPPRHRRPRKPLHQHILLLLLHLLALLLSSFVVAHSASTLGRELGLSSTAVGATILSLATTLPEKVLAVLGGVRKQPGILVANTVGSNIFLVTLCAGVLFLGGEGEILAGGWTWFELGVCWGAAVVVLGVVVCGGRRWMGWVMLGGYVGFLGVEVWMGRRVDDD